MNAKTHKRFKAVWHRTTSFDPSTMAIDNPMLCPVGDAEEALKNGIAVRLPNDTPITTNYFSLVEEKEDKNNTSNDTNKKKVMIERRRAINWAKLFNEKNADYEADVNLKHNSEYFHRARQ